MLEIRGLTKHFGAVPVLRGIDLSIRPGRTTAILGPNGAGKTTLIKSVLGLTRPDGGTIRIGGEPATGDAYRARIGYMPQIARFPDNLTAADLIALMCELRGAAGTEERRDALVERLELGPHLRKPLRALSGGTRQKVNAVLALLFRPPLLILDEPTAGLDPLSSATLKDEIASERDAGRTIVLTSHITSDLEELADDVVFLIEGRVAFSGSLTELLQRSGQSRLDRAVAQIMRGSAPAARASLEVA